jgi:DNA-binding LytR/AlgR family response regulator
MPEEVASPSPDRSGPHRRSGVPGRSGRSGGVAKWQSEGPRNRPPRDREIVPPGPSVAPQVLADDFIFVKDGTKLVKIMINDILYVEGLKDYVTIHTDKQKVVSLQRLKSLEEQLPTSIFIRIHNSFIVSLRSIKSVHKNEVEIGNAFIPVGETYRKSFKEAIEKRQVE